MSLHPLHSSILSKVHKRPYGLSRTPVSLELRTFLETEALDIYTRMVNAGCSLQQTLTAVYLSGMSAAREATK